MYGALDALDPAVLEEWKASVGRSETRTEILEHESLRRYALAVGSDPKIEQIMPPLAHWAFFLPQPEDGEIGEDGHPRRGGFLPAITLPRRMFAAADIRFQVPLLLGEAAEMLSSIANVAHKSGQSGDLVFVDVDRTISQKGSVRVRERQTYVYRDMGSPAPMPVPEDPPVEGELWQPGPVTLFRFSAATFNGHRIHYDLPYAREEEGYPALVVHGPFTAAKLAAFAGHEGRLARFSFRAQSPLFLGQPIRFQRGDGEVRAMRCDGATAMTAKVVYQ
jgi:3-methylfumaryl-CoA hydratase